MYLGKQLCGFVLNRRGRRSRQFRRDGRASERRDGDPAQRCNNVAIGATNAGQHVVQEIALAGRRLTREAEMFMLTFAFHGVSPFDLAARAPLQRSEPHAMAKGLVLRRVEVVVGGVRHQHLAADVG